MKTASILDVIGALEINLASLKTYATNAANQKAVDMHSDHTFYGVPDSVIEEVESANDTILLATKKLKSVVVPA